MSIWPQAMSYGRPSSDGRLREAGDRVLGRGVGRRVRARRVRRDRSVVDDAAAARLLGLHQPERLLRAQERAGQVHVDDGLPLLDRQVLERDAGRASIPALLNSRSSRPNAVARGVEQRTHRLPDRRRRSAPTSARVARRPGSRDRLLEQRRAAAGEHDRVAVVEQADRDGPPDARARAGDEGDLQWCRSRRRTVT